ncbi:hypothetical protein QYE76_053466 [Lolium multiflorum]|uniref:CCHC-type domain-containing protein n=1 Tax=Lolium multiflorum TaxID=4521 RepID=A0AAD8SW43_LOLMU|nr:hypothetical protein QYE76_053466 [Lolium multiflorum]
MEDVLAVVGKKVWEEAEETTTMKAGRVVPPRMVRQRIREVSTSTMSLEMVFSVQVRGDKISVLEIGNIKDTITERMGDTILDTMRMVADAAEAFARQLAGQSEPSQSAAPQYVPKVSANHAGQGSSVVRQPGFARAPPIPAAGQHTANVQGQPHAQRAEEVLLAVAGCASKEVIGESEILTEEDYVAATRKKGPSCFRCRTAGHFLNDCEVVLCDCCQRPEHATKDCPLLRAPRPRLAMYGMGHPDLAFWELPLSKGVRPRVENTRFGRVEVSGSSLTSAQLIVHLQWIVPDPQYIWVVQQMEENVFRVNFPSKNELVRVQHFGRFHVPNSTIILSFDLWKKEIEPAWVPEDVWVRVHGLSPVALDDYLALWALGDVFGKTKEIDIFFTRKHNVLRMLITSLDTALIPESWDLKIKHEFFRLRFEVEGEQWTNTLDVTMSDVQGDGGDDESNNNDHDKPADGDLERNVKRNKNVDGTSEGNGTPNSQPELNTSSHSSQMNKASLLDASVLTNTMNTQSAVMEGAAEYVPILPPSDSISNFNKPKKIVFVPEGVPAGEEAGRTSIGSTLHAALGHEATTQLPSRPMAAGGPASSQSFKHGMNSLMHSAESLPVSTLASNFANSSGSAKVNKPASFHVNHNFVESYTSILSDTQGVCSPGSDVPVVNVNSSKFLPRYDEVPVLYNTNRISPKLSYSSHSAAMENGEGYAQTVLPAAELADKAGKDTLMVADMHGAR